MKKLTSVFLSLTFYGTTTLFTQAYKLNPKKSLKKLNTPGKLYYKKNKLDTSLSLKIYKLFMDPNIVDIPSGKRIWGWETGDDGITYVLEYSTPNCLLA